MTQTVTYNLPDLADILLQKTVFPLVLSNQQISMKSSFFVIESMVIKYWKYRWLISIFNSIFISSNKMRKYTAVIHHNSVQIIVKILMLYGY